MDSSAAHRRSAWREGAKAPKIGVVGVLRSLAAGGRRETVSVDSHYSLRGRPDGAALSVTCARGPGGQDDRRKRMRRRSGRVRSQAHELERALEAKALDPDDPQRPEGHLRFDDEARKEGNPEAGCNALRDGFTARQLERDAGFDARAAQGVERKLARSGAGLAADEVEVFEFAQCNRAAPREAMADGRNDEHQLVAGKRQALEVVTFDRSLDEGESEFAAAHELRHRCSVGDLDLDADSRMLLPECSQQLREHVGPDGQRRAEAQRPELDRGEFAHVTLERLGSAEQCCGARRQEATRVGEHGAPLDDVDQANSD